MSWRKGQGERRETPNSRKKEPESLDSVRKANFQFLWWTLFFLWLALTISLDKFCFTEKLSVSFMIVSGHVFSAEVLAIHEFALPGITIFCCLVAKLLTPQISCFSFSSPSTFSLNFSHSIFLCACLSNSPHEHFYPRMLLGAKCVDAQGA